MQHAPHYPECHNLNGLSCESQFDYQSAVASYRLARYAVANSSGNVSKSHIRDISINLARSLSMVMMFYVFSICLWYYTYIYACVYNYLYIKIYFTWYCILVWMSLCFPFFNRCFHVVQAGNALEALQECEVLKKEGVAFSFSLSLTCKVASYCFHLHIAL